MWNHHHFHPAFPQALWCLLLSWLQCLVPCQCGSALGLGCSNDGVCVCAAAAPLGLNPLCKGQARARDPSAVLCSFRGETMLWDFPTQDSYSWALPPALFLSWFGLLIHVQMQELFSYLQCCILKYPEMCKRVLRMRAAFICIRLFHFVLDSEWNISEQELPVNCAVLGDLSFLGAIGHFPTSNLICPKAYMSCQLQV